jgi:hypothetical protein
LQPAYIKEIYLGCARMEILEVLVDGASCGTTSGYVTTLMIKEWLATKLALWSP